MPLPPTRLQAVVLLRQLLRELLPLLPSQALRERAASALHATQFLQAPLRPAQGVPEPFGWAIRRAGRNDAWGLETDEAHAQWCMAARDAAGTPHFEVVALAAMPGARLPAGAAATADNKQAPAQKATPRRLKVLFLDFDGVLHPLGLAPAAGAPVAGKPRVRAVPVDLFCWAPLLSELLAPFPEVGIVVHSTWRDNRGIQDLARCLGPLAPRLLGATAGGPKLASIRAYLAAHPDVASYRVLDDVPLAPSAELPQLIRCDSRTGVSRPVVQQALRAWLAEP
jgi:hypothetical protein